MYSLLSEPPGKPSIDMFLLTEVHSLYDSPSGSVVKNPPAKQETRVRSLGEEDPLEKEIATHLTIPASRIPWTEEPGRLQSMGLQKSWTMYIYLCISEELILSNCGARDSS